MSLIFFDGFEYTGQNSKSYWNGWYAANSSFVYDDTTRPIATRYGYGKTALMTNSGSKILYFPSSQDIIFGFAINFDYSAQVDSDFLLIRSPAGSDVFLFSRSSNDNLISIKNSYGVIYQGSIPIPNNQWAYLEVHLKLDNTNGIIETRINEVVDISENNIPTITNSISMNHLYIGHLYGSGATSRYMYIDDFYLINKEPTDNYLGDIRVARIKPINDTAQKDFTPSTGSDNFALLTDDDTDTYVSSKEKTAKDIYTLANAIPEISTIEAIRGGFSFKTTGSKLNAKGSINLTAQKLEASGIINPSNTLLFTDVYKENPETSQPWTTVDINTMESEIGFLEE